MKDAHTLTGSSDAALNVNFVPLDLNSIQQTVLAAQELRKRLKEDKHDGIDILVCNAGILGAPLRQLSEDGFEKHFATHCLGHFTFVNLLLGNVNLLEICFSQLIRNRSRQDCCRQNEGREDRLCGFRWVRAG